MLKRLWAQLRSFWADEELACQDPHCEVCRYYKAHSF